MRIGLMTDVRSVAIASDSGLLVDEPAGGLNQDSAVKRAKSEQLRPELVQRGRLRFAVTREASASVRRIEVAAAPDSQSARKVADRLKDRFEEPVTTTYDDDRGRYVVMIGRLKDERETNDLIKRLERAGYKKVGISVEQEMRASGLRVAAFEGTKQVVASDSALLASSGSAAIARARKSRMVTQEAAIRRDRTDGAKAQSEGDQPFDDSIQVGSRAYRGDVQFVLNTRGLINVVNVIPLEDYLRGVVPMELSPSGFPSLEALKAQAVAARSYALARRSINQSDAFDLRDDARSQVYGGLSAENPLSSRAVEETRGQIAEYAGEPIEALYTSTCGGRTENNDAVFSSRPASYLRSVECAPDQLRLDKHEIKSGRQSQLLVGSDGRSLAREYALLDVLGFGLPSRPTTQFLRSTVSKDDIYKLADRLAELSGVSTPLTKRGDATRLAGFAATLAESLYGHGRPSALLSPADVDHILDGLSVDSMPANVRADFAQLLADGILKLPSDLRLFDTAPLTRDYVIETISRAVLLKNGSGSRDDASQSSSLDKVIQIGTAEPSERGRLLIASKSRTKQQSTVREIEIDSAAWLFRRIAGESYQIARLKIVGGERIRFHLNKAGRVDFLEVEPAPRGAASDRVSSAWLWEVRLPVEELRRRLLRARIDVGDLRDLVPMTRGESNRVIELDVIGEKGTRRLRNSAVRTVLGLKESLFVVSREMNGEEEGGPTAFVFKGRGWGHGVGMCQVGAYGLAREGYSYSEILKKYYTGIRIAKAY